MLYLQQHYNTASSHSHGRRSSFLTVLCDLLDVAAAGLDEGVEVPGDMVVAARFSVRHVGSSEPDSPAENTSQPGDRSIDSSSAEVLK